MHRADFDKRVKALEARHHADQGSDETRLFLERLTDEELRRGAGISERYEAGIPPTEEEQSFLDGLEVKYGTI